MKKILILNGAGKKNGNTAALIKAFTEGAESAGNEVKNAALKKFSDMNNKAFGDKAYIKWNFTKFLVDREGKVIARFEPTADMKDVRDAVEAAL